MGGNLAGEKTKVTKIDVSLPILAIVFQLSIDEDSGAVDIRQIRATFERGEFSERFFLLIIFYFFSKIFFLIKLQPNPE